MGYANKVVMNTCASLHKRTCLAFTLLELMIVTLAIAILVIILLPVFAKPGHGNSPRINCVNNLKQVGLSFRLWAGDHGDQFPSQVSVAEGGTLELVNAAGVSPHFTVMSNELSTPKILACRSDDSRIAATNFATLRDTNVSYFVVVSAAEANPDSWLAGDRNISSQSPPTRGVLNLTTTSPVEWTDKIHQKQGNVCMADGSVQQLSSSKLLNSLRRQTNSPLRLAMPE